MAALAWRLVVIAATLLLAPPLMGWPAAIARLGPLFVKLGQVASVRPDLVSEKWSQRCRGLRDRVPFDATLYRHKEHTLVARHLLNRPPLASGSVADVFACRHLVFKVLKPGVRRRIDSDMRLLMWVSAHMDRWRPQWRAAEVLQQLHSHLIPQLDFRTEARHICAARHILADVGVDVPDVIYADASVLVMRRVWCRATPPPSAGDQLRRAMTAMMRHAFVHLDLHPGNVLWRRDSGRAVVIDWGLAHRIDADVMAIFTATMAALQARRYAAVADLFRHHSPCANVDPQTWRRACRDAIAKDAAADDVFATLMRIVAACSRHRVAVEPRMSSLVMAMAIVEGHLRELGHASSSSFLIAGSGDAMQ